MGIAALHPSYGMLGAYGSAIGVRPDFPHLGGQAGVR